MKRVVPYPDDLFAAGRKHVALLAHQDDELPYAGILSRLGADTPFLYVTNGDGTAPMAGEEPEPHAAQRWKETNDALDILEVPDEQRHCFGFSELMFYAGFAEMFRNKGGDVPACFTESARVVIDRIVGESPDVIWTMAWQGGNPEHDLTHLMAVQAARELNVRRRAAGQADVQVYGFPAYEFVFLVPLRYKPWADLEVHTIEIDAAEYARKMQMFSCYPSQQALLDSFRRLINIYGWLSLLRGRRFTFEQYGSREEFRRVDVASDYQSSTHMFDFLDYMFDDYEGTPVRFKHTLPRIARAILGTS